MTENPKELIPLTPASIGDEKQQTVNARELHAFLEVKTAFRDWIRRRIGDFEFCEGVDYAKIEDKSSRSNLSGGQERIDYFLSLSMAKELAMVERNAKGKEARLYFINCEKIAKSKKSVFVIPDNLPDALRLAADLAAKAKKLEHEKMQLELQAANDAPKVEFTEAVTAGATDVNITAAAKTLGIGPRKFFDWLRQKGYIYKQSNQANQTMINSGCMVTRFANINHSDGMEKRPYAHVTGKGLYYFYRQLRKDNLIAVNQKLELTA